MRKKKPSELATYTEIYEELSKYPNLRINSPQTARNVCESAIKKLERLMSQKRKEDFIDLLNDCVGINRPYSSLIS